LIFAFVTFGLLVVLDPASSTALGGVLWTATLVNLGFFVFNMIPLPPLDGSRVLYALAPDFVRRGMEMIEQLGIVFIFLIVIVANSQIGSFMLAAINGILGVFSRLFGV